MMSERETRRQGGSRARFVTDDDGVPVPLFGLGDG
jgi:hypothetical protein